MAITYKTKNSANGTAVVLTGVAIGSLIVVLMEWFDSAGSPTVLESGGAGSASTWAYATSKNNGGAEYIRFAYTLYSNKSGNITYTGSSPTNTISAMEYSVTAGNTWLLDHIDAIGTGNDTTLESGNETSTETSMVGFVGGGWYSSTPYVSTTLDGVAADQATSIIDSVDGTGNALGASILNNPGTYGGVIEITNPVTWVADLIGFKEAAGGSAPVAMNTYKQRRNV